MLKKLLLASTLLCATANVANAQAILSLGTSGSVLGETIYYNTTSGSITVEPPTGALGSVALTLPAVTGKIPSITSSIASGDCVEFSGTAGGLQDAGAACGSGGSSGLVIGATTITGGTSGDIEYNNAGVLGELATTGSGSVVRATSPTLVTPALGTPSALVLTNATGLPDSGIVAQTANTVLGALTATNPSGLALPSCSTTSSALTWTSGTGFGCNTITGSGSAANPTATAGPTAINGSASTYMRSDAAPAVQTASASQFGIIEPDNQVFVCPSGICTTTAPDSTFTASHTVVATDMGGQTNMNVTGGGTLTIPAISTTIFPAGKTLLVVNQSASALTVANGSGPTINNCTSPIASGAAWQLTSNGTSLDCIAIAGSVTIAVGSQPTSGGTNYALLQQVSNVVQTSAVTDNGSTVSIARGARTTPVALTDGATIASNAAQSNVFTVTIAGARTLSNPTNLAAGQTLTYEITQDGTGNRTLAYGSYFNWLAGIAPPLNTAANAKTTISCFADSTATLQCAGGAPVSSATNQTNVSAPTAPASTSAYKMQGLAASITPATTGNILVTISGTIVAPTGTTVDNGILYQISYGTGTAPANAAALTGTQVGGIQEYTSAVAPTAAADVHVPFSHSAVITGLGVGTTYWIDEAAESVTTASAMGLSNVSVSVVEMR